MNDRKVVYFRVNNFAIGQIEMRSKMLIRVFVVVVLLEFCQAQNDWYGTAELVQAPRRSRVLSDFVAERNEPEATIIASTEPTSDASLPVTKPTMDTLKRYARIFKMDAKILTPQQRVLLERIVERVARLNGGTLEPTSATLESTEATVQGDDVEGRARHKNRKNATKKNKTEGTSATTDELTSSPVPPTKATKRTTSGIIAHKSKGGKSKVTQANDLTMSNVTAVDLGNITTTSIVNILSTDNARENLYSRRPTTQDKLISATSNTANSKVSLSKLFQLEFLMSFSRGKEHLINHFPMKSNVNKRITKNETTLRKEIDFWPNTLNDFGVSHDTNREQFRYIFHLRS